MSEFATSSPDLKYWTAHFTDPTHHSEFTGGASPVQFNPAYYYTLSISDQAVNIGAYGTPTEPYWVLVGLQ